jgi:hypothetical protein
MTAIAELLEQELKLKVNDIIYIDDFTQIEIHRFVSSERTSRPKKVIYRPTFSSTFVDLIAEITKTLPSPFFSQRAPGYRMICYQQCPK